MAVQTDTETPSKTLLILPQMLSNVQHTCDVKSSLSKERRALFS